jgi:hypothetical protein
MGEINIAGNDFSWMGAGILGSLYFCLDNKSNTVG